MPHPCRQAGFTLAETLVSVALLAAVLLPLSGAYAAATSLWRGMRQREIAAREVHNAAAAVEVVPFGRLLPGSHRLPAPDLPRGEVTVTIGWQPELQLVRAKVRVSWQAQTGLQAVEREVVRSPYGPYQPAEAAIEGEEEQP